VSIDPQRDVEFVMGRRIHWTCSRIQDYGSKMGIDATRKWESEGFRRPWPDEIVMDAGTKCALTHLAYPWAETVRGNS